MTQQFATIETVRAAIAGFQTRHLHPDRLPFHVEGLYSIEEFRRCDHRMLRGCYQLFGDDRLLTYVGHTWVTFGARIGTQLRPAMLAGAFFTKNPPKFISLIATDAEWESL